MEGWKRGKRGGLEERAMNCATKQLSLLTRNTDLLDLAIQQERPGPVGAEGGREKG
jgi:hypothetical protein